jgi:hypothetical protein
MSALLRRRRSWWVEAAGKVWGPYADARLADFAAEGRIGYQTPVSTSPEGPFLPASDQPELAALFPDAGPRPEPVVALQPRPQPAAQPRPQPVVAETAPAPRPTPVSQTVQAVISDNPAGRALLVWASVSPSGVEAFEQLLAIHGPWVAMGPNLWLVKARMPAAGLRNALTRRLKGAEALLVAEASIAEAAWFNLDGPVDRAARQLWIEG